MSSDYLRAPIKISVASVLFLLAALYTSAANAALAGSFLLLTALGLLMLLRASRWSCYVLAMLGLIVHSYTYVFHISNGPHDRDSDRDEAVESATQSFIDGRNPWSTQSPLGNAITTGPASVLLAAPVVAMFDEVDVVTFAVYLFLFGFLAYGDLSTRNETFIPIALVIITGVLGFQHTMHWSLEELYFGIPFMATAWLLLRHGSPVYSGACLSLTLLVRTSYAFAVFGFLLWFATTRQFTRSSVVRVAWGMLFGAVVGLAPFVVTAGPEFVARNPFTVAGSYLTSAWPDTNVAFRLLNGLLRFAGGGAGVLKAVVGLAAVALIAWSIRRHAITHPFWHIAAGGFVASLVVLWPDWMDDYWLMFVWPTVMAAAWSPSTSCHRTIADSSRAATFTSCSSDR